MKTISREELKNVKTDKDFKNVAISVQLYKYFLSNGPEGHDAFRLYMHLVFTVILQETNQVEARDVYICRGLSWGKDKTKRVKSWLAKHGLIEYIWIRKLDGQIDQVYIKVNLLLPDSDTSENNDTTNQTTGVDVHPVAEPAHCPEPQMLECLNINSLSDMNDRIASEVCSKWYSAYSKYTKFETKHQSGDHSAALKLINSCPELRLDTSFELIDKAILNHFDNWRLAWFLKTDTTRNLSDSLQQPYWNFKNFCTRFSEILRLDSSNTRDSVSSPCQTRTKKYRKESNCVSEETRDSIIRKIEAEQGDAKQ
jgi:hypothetical protein